MPNTGDALRWRVGDRCEPVGRAEWWEHRDASKESDAFAQSSDFTLSDATPGALRLARQWADFDPFATDEEVLRALGVLRSDGRLSEAGG